MKVSVVICSYTLDSYEHFEEAVESVLNQTYDDVELVLVSDGNEAVYERLREDYGDRDDVVVTMTDENVGISAARNHGIEHASGDVVAQIDDDAIADPEWVEELVGVYEETDAVAVGGKMTAAWVAGKPSFLPEEFYWLIGVTHRGFADPGEEVRNTFGSNISFRREVIEELGGFDPHVGRKGDAEIQAHESELGTRLRREFGRGVIYNPDAKVAHKVFDYRTDPWWLAKRAFWQGYSKRALETLIPDAEGGEESEFLKFLLLESVPDRLRGLLRNPSGARASQLVWLLLLTGLVGFGYLYGITKWR
ncbi:glucosyl-dolichyl phosphate glucuronosyltransferase [Halobellus litoreus]|uniref:Glucosyl-dolichyl phosphate glucuronosyltransferase n=1 Tax=Halobellus litoreus TaxID=755310 RepID=A0ABD6DYF4_9EURY|nr:glucosyl-dolichyl phosphate glucuronosyltransferase [Halobellus litoreus]